MKKTKKILMLLFFALFLTVHTRAEVYRPLQIFLPGNFAGKDVSVDMNLKLKEGPFWQLPSLAEYLLASDTKDTVTIGLGNNSSIFSPVSFLFRGSVEDALLDAFKPDTRNIAVTELELYADRYLPQAMLNTVWTNHLREDDTALCKWYGIASFTGGEMLTFNFIEPALCTHLPLDLWNTRTEPSLRALLRLETVLPPFSDNLITVSTAYLSKSKCLELAEEFKQLKGTHIIIQIPVENINTAFSETSVEQDANVYMLSLPANTGNLPILEVFRRNNAWPRIRFRHPSAEKAPFLKNLFLEHEKYIKDEVVKLLKVISPAKQASTQPFTFQEKAQARMLRGFDKADIAIIKPPEADYFTDNVICKGHILSAVKNDRIFSLRMSGSDLVNMFNELIPRNAHLGLVFDGCEIQWSAYRLKKLEIGSQPCELKRTYFVNMTEETFRHISGFTQLPANKVSYRGSTLWKIWLSQLKNTRISESELVK